MHDIDYRITDNPNVSFAYNKATHSIIFGKQCTLNNLTDNEICEYISDAITHEFIHHILYELFGSITCQLFDVIGDKLRNNYLLEKEIGQSMNTETYTNYMSKYGFDGLLSYFGLSHYDVKVAQNLCNKR